MSGMDIERQESVREKWVEANAAVPSEGVLYHYTSFDGIFGIARERAIWATESTYLTDASEFRFGLDLLKEGVHARMTSGSVQETNELLRQFLRFLNDGTIKSTRVFVVSFSQNRDQLSQWRGYTPEDLGVSVGFGKAKLRRLAESQGFHLAPCVYSPNDQNEIVSKIINLVLLAERDRVVGYEYWTWFQQNVSTVLSLLLQIKHPAFHEEREVRLISNNAYLEKEIEYRVTRSSVIPYVRFYLPRYEVDPECDEPDELRRTGDIPDETWLDIHSVFMGPSSLDGQRTVGSLHRALRRAKVYMEYNVCRSTIPYTPRVR